MVVSKRQMWFDLGRNYLQLLSVKKNVATSREKSYNFFLFGLNQILLVRLQNLVCAHFYQILFLTWRQLRQFSTPGHKTLYAIANEKLLFCDVPNSRTSISQNYQF